MHKQLAKGAAIAAFLFAAPSVYSAVTPVVGDYGNVFPVLTEQNLSAARPAAAAPWYVSFNLLAQADLRIGALGLGAGAGSGSGFFDLTAIRLVDINGTNVAFGTDTFSVNPFPSSIEALIVVNNLAPGRYAVEISGTGNRFSCTTGCSDIADFTTRLQVLQAAPVPEPGSYLLMVSGMGYLAWRRRESLRSAVAQK